MGADVLRVMQRLQLAPRWICNGMEFGESYTQSLRVNSLG